MAKTKKVDEAVEAVKEEVEAVETVKAEEVVDESPVAVKAEPVVVEAKPVAVAKTVAQVGISISSSTLKSQNVAVSAGVVAFDKDGNAVVSEAVLKAITPFFDAFKIVVRK